MDHVRDYTQLDSSRDCYWSIAAFPSGVNTNQHGHALDVRALVIDDVGTKGPSAGAVVLALNEPTTIVETSPGNFQYGYRLSKPVAKADWRGFFGGIEAMIGHKVPLDAPACQTLMRLPMGINTKGSDTKGKMKLGHGGTFKVRLVAVNAGVALDPDTIRRAVVTFGTSGNSQPAHSVRDICGLMALIPNNDVHYDDWFAHAERTMALAVDEETALEGFTLWSEKSSKHDPAEIALRWGSVDPTRTSGKELLLEAERADPEGYRAWLARESATAFPDAVDPAEVAAAAAMGVEFSVDQEKSSIAVVEHLAGRLKKVGRGSWREFDETTGRWREWTDDHMLRRVLEMVRARKTRPMAPAISKKLEGIRFIAGIAQAASLHRTVIAKATDFDCSPLILGVPSGVIELGKGKSRAVRKGRASEMVSKAMWVDPASPGTPHPEWSRFLAEFTEQDAGLEEWLQVHAGYCLTGLMEQHILPYFHGSGGNGKSVYLNALRSVWGEYATQMDHRLLFEKQGGYHLSPLAVLAGVRLAVVTDVPADAVWDVHIMKMLTGDDAITANRMHQDPITFKSSAKIAVSGNTEPVVKDMDEGIRRRLKSLPLTATPAVQDIRLSQKLAAEWGAILNWALTGLDMYWALGDLPVSKTVEDATTAYHTLLDPLQRWLDTGLEKDPSPGARVSAKELYQSWQAFKAAEGRFNMQPNSSAHLNRKMIEKKFVFNPLHGRSYLYGYKITNSSAADVF
jgi:putative DNA primase/helicase